MRDTKLVQTSIDGDPHTLVRRRQSTESTPFGRTFDLVPDDEPTDVLAMTNQESARFLHEWRNSVDRPLRNVGVLSLGEQMRSSAGTTAGEPTSTPQKQRTPSRPGHPTIRGVADPTDTEAIQDTVESLLETWPEEGQTVVYFESVTQLVESLRADASTNFISELFETLDAYDAVGYFCLTPAAHSRAVVDQITSLFDTVVECVETTPELTPDPSVSDYFGALADSRRRNVLVEVSDRYEVSIDDLTDRVTAADSANRKQVKTSLMHVHLPKLADIGAVVYDREDGLVARGEQFGQVEPLLEKATGQA